MSLSKYRKQIYIVILLSALFRFGFLFFGDILPVMWDARRYVGASIGLISYVDDTGDTQFSTPLQDRYRFQHYTNKYIQGEQIEWLKYKPFSLTEARNEIFIGGPLYPFLCSLVIYAAPSNDFTYLRVMNILLDILATLLVMLVACRFIGKKGAIITGLLYVFYFPFTLLTSMMLLESSTTLLLLVTIYCLLRSEEDRQYKYLFVAGFSLGLLLINKPTALLLIFPLLISYFWYSKDKLVSKLSLKKAAVILIPFFLIGISWTAVASSKYGELTLRDPSYKEANLRQSSNITFEGYDLDKVEKDFWNYSVSEHISSNKLEYVGLLVKKFERMWSKTANDFRKSYILTADTWEKVHLLLVITGLFGLMLMLLQNPKVGVWIISIVLYYTGIHVIFHSVARYSFNALPLLFIASSYFILKIYDYLMSNDKQKKLFYLSIAGLCLISIWRTEYINSLMSIELTQLFVLISLFLLSALCFSCLYFISVKLVNQKSKLKVLLLPFLSTLIFIGGFYSTVLSRNEWSEFSCKIIDPTMKAGSRIYIEPSSISEETGIIAVLIDLNSGADRQNTFTIAIGDSLAEYVGGQPPLSNLFYPKPTYKFYSKFIPLGIEQFRQYAIIPIEFAEVHEMLDSVGYIDISVAINDRIEEENNFINLFGNFETNEEEHFIPGIRFTSVERHVNRGDPRIKYPVKYLSKKVISYYIKRNADNIANTTDLSPSSGLQSGRYNIFLVHFFPNGDFKVY